MRPLQCDQCGITPQEINADNARDYFIPTGNRNEMTCTTCALHNAAMDARNPSGARLTTLILAARANARGWAHRQKQLEQEAETLRNRLRLAEDFAALAEDHLAGCITDTTLTDALTEWHHAAGIQAVPEDDALRGEL